MYVCVCILFFARDLNSIFVVDLTVIALYYLLIVVDNPDARRILMHLWAKKTGKVIESERHFSS